MEKIRQHILDNQEAYLDELKRFLAFKSISANPNFKQDITNCANYLNEYFNHLGFTSTIFQTQGHPIVFAERIEDESLPTVMFYGHYDVQPPEPLELWKTPPFEATIVDGQLIARGASDDKGQVFCHIAAVSSFLKVNKTLPVNFKFLIEGEEEVGSKHLTSFIEEHKKLLNTDMLIVSDTPMIAKGYPTLCTSLRGLVYIEITLTTGTTDLHSGQHGGAVPNAINELVNLLSKFKNENQQILIPNFYDGVEDLDQKKKNELNSLPLTDEAYLGQTGTFGLVKLKDVSCVAQRWYLPTFDINGIVGGYIGEGAKTVIPCEAKAKVSMRLVGNQNPNKIVESFKSFITKIAPSYVKISLEVHHPGWPISVSEDYKGVKEAKLAMSKGFSLPVVSTGEGGSIPILAQMEKLLGIKPILMGFNLPDDKIHAPNERFSLENFKAGCLSAAYFYDLISKK